MPAVFGTLLSILVIIAFVYSLVWAYRDARDRGRSGWLAALMVAVLAWPIGLLVWYVLRPENPPKATAGA